MKGIKEFINYHQLNVFHSKPENNMCKATIFFFHGSMATYQQFNDIINGLKDYGSCNIVAYDALGCGNSEKPTDIDCYSTNSMLKDALVIVEKYATAMNILVGHSYGSSLVARLCHHYKQTKNDIMYASIKGLILLGTTDSLPNGGHPIFQLPICLLNLIQSYLSNTFIELAFSPNTDKVIKMKSLAMSSSNKMYVCRAFYQQFEWATIDDWNSIISFPILICQGMYSMYVLYYQPMCIVMCTYYV